LGDLATISIAVTAGRQWLNARMRSLPVDNQQESRYTTSVDIKRNAMPHPASEVSRGTLDLMILKTLDTLGTMHGWGIAQRIRQVSKDLLQLNQGTLYPALLRVEQNGWIRAEWKITENNRRARYYALTNAGKKQLEAEAREWRLFAGFMARLLDTGE
jgi:PadR family transcriptional regulator, regulatory protein PadR